MIAATLGVVVIGPAGCADDDGDGASAGQDDPTTARESAHEHTTRANVVGHGGFA